MGQRCQRPHRRFVILINSIKKFYIYLRKVGA